MNLNEMKQIREIPEDVLQMAEKLKPMVYEAFDLWEKKTGRGTWAVIVLICSAVLMVPLTNFLLPFVLDFMKIIDPNGVTLLLFVVFAATFVILYAITRLFTNRAYGGKLSLAQQHIFNLYLGVDVLRNRDIYRTDILHALDLLGKHDMAPIREYSIGECLYSELKHYREQKKKQFVMEK